MKDKDREFDLERFNRTRRMILSRVLLVPFVTVMIVVSTVVYYFALNLRHEVNKELTSLTESRRIIIDQFLKERVWDLRFAASAFSLDQLTSQEGIDRALELLQSGSPAFFDLGLFDQQGRHVSYSGPYALKGKDYSREEWFLAARDQDKYISDVFLGFRNQPHFIIVVRKIKEGEAWFLRATIDTDFFNNLVKEIRVGKTGEAYLVNDKGQFQTERRSGGRLMEPDPDWGRYPVNTDQIKTVSAEDHQGASWLWSVGRLNKAGWSMVVRQEVSDAYFPLARMVLISIAIVVAGGGVVVVLSYILAGSLANQLTVADLEKRQMGTQLIMAGKLAEVGEMSAGLAHEINNPLQVMKSEYAMLDDLLGEVERGDGRVEQESLRLIRDSVDQINLQIERCKGITQGLLKFARKSEPAMQTVEIPKLVSAIVALVERRAELENVKIVQKFDPELPPLTSDPGQLQQVILNLVNNAIYAVRDQEDKVVRITASLENSRLVLAVADNGCGIPPELLEKIFLPFYTTKPAGQGTGLGLSTVYGIVERLGGQITVASEPGVGSVFTVNLPLSGPPPKGKGQS